MKPIWRAPLRPCLERFLAVFYEAHDVLDDHDRVIHDETTEIVSAIREDVETVPHKYIAGKSAGERERTVTVANYLGRIAEEKEHPMTTSPTPT